jgi:hypothetical protein
LKAKNIIYEQFEDDSGRNGQKRSTTKLQRFSMLNSVMRGPKQIPAKLNSYTAPKGVSISN